MLDAGEAAIIDLWRTLGLTIEVLPDRRCAIWVSEPAAWSMTASVHTAMVPLPPARLSG